MQDALDPSTTPQNAACFELTRSSGPQDVEGYGLAQQGKALLGARLTRCAGAVCR